MKKIASILLTVCLSVAYCLSQPFTERKWGGNLYEMGKKAFQAKDGTLFFFGSGQNSSGDVDVYMAKYSLAGDLLFEKYFGDAMDNNLGSAIDNQDGTFTLCGFSQSTILGPQGFLLKVDSLGNQAFMHHFGGAEGNFFEDVVKNKEGGWTIGGYKHDPSGFFDAWVINTNIFGFQVWEKTYGSAGKTETCDGLTTLTDGGFALAVTANSTISDDFQARLIKTDRWGNTMWERDFGGPLADGCQGVLQMPSGKLVIFGEGYPAPGAMFDFVFGITDLAGNVLVNKYIGEDQADALFDGIYYGPEKTLKFTGYSNSTGTNGGNDLVLATIDTTGNLLSMQKLGTSRLDMGYGISTGKNNAIILAGRTTGELTQEDYFLLWNTLPDPPPLSLPEDLANPPALFLFPNPSTGSFMISGELIPERITINTLQGKSIPYTIDPVSHSITLRDPAPGIYLVQFEHKTGPKHCKLLITEKD